MPVHDWSKVEAGVFHDFHHELITAVKHTLNSGVLPPGYYAMAGQVNWRGHPTTPGKLRSSSMTVPAAASDGVVIAPPACTHEETADRMPSPGSRRHVVIRNDHTDATVAVVELVAPSNKNNTAAARTFAEKLADYLVEGVHLLVVDLLRPGRADPNGIHPLIWKAFKKKARLTLTPEKPLTLAAYAAGDPVRAFVEPTAVGEPLPDMPLFLTPESHVPVPLEASYAAAWAMVPPRWRDELAPPR